MDYPSIMKKLFAYIAVLIAVFSVVSTTYMYSYYEGQIADMRLTINALEREIAGLRSELYKYRNLTLVDDRGYVLNLTSYPERIVSLAPSNTEILFAVGAGDRVVGVTNQCVGFVSPTTLSPAPTANRISVLLGESDTILSG